MKNLNYHDIVKKVKTKHKEFFKKYKVFVSKNINSRMLERTKLFARLQLVCKAFVEAGVVEKYDIANILGHSDSIVLNVTGGLESIYLLNDCTDLIILSGYVASEDALSGRIILTQGKSYSAKTTVCKRYSNVLDENFDWMDFSSDLLDVIHKSIYNEEDVKKDFYSNSIL